MRFGLFEILGVFLVVVGCGTVVAAASFVSTGLAVLAAGAFLITGGIVVVYLVAALEAEAKKAAASDRSRTT